MAARRSSITAAAGRRTISVAATAARPRSALGVVYIVERAGAGEDRGVLGRRSAVRAASLPHDRRLRARRGRDVRRARTRGSRTASRGRATCSRRSSTIPTRSLIVIDPAAQRDGGAGRHPPAGPPGHRRMVPRRAARGPDRGGPRRRRLARRARQRLRRAARPSREGADRAVVCDRRRATKTDVRAVARRHRVRVERVGLRGPRHPTGAATAR